MKRVDQSLVLYFTVRSGVIGSRMRGGDGSPITPDRRYEGRKATFRRTEEWEPCVCTIGFVIASPTLQWARLARVGVGSVAVDGSTFKYGASFFSLKV